MLHDQPCSHTFLISSSRRFRSSSSFSFCRLRSSFSFCTWDRTSLSYSRRSGDVVALIPRCPTMNRRATASVVNGLPPGEEFRIRDGFDEVDICECVDEDRALVVVPSERRSLPIGF